jgi:REP element-mobilizing transposase RayT
VPDRDFRFPKKIRLPAEAYENPDAVFHITMHAATETAPFKPKRAADVVWQLVRNEESRGSITPVAACLMPTHLHLVARRGRKTIVEWANGFKSYSTTVWWREGGGHGVLWQPSFYDVRQYSSRQVEAVIKYVVRNPVDAGFVEDPWQWPWVWVSDDVVFD